MIALAELEGEGKNVQQNGFLRIWCSYIGSYAFYCFRNIEKQKVKLIV